MRNPLLDVREDISEKPVAHLSFFEKIGLFCALIISIVILILSGFSFYIDLFIKSNYIFALIDFLIILMCIWAIYFILNVIKRKIVTEILIDTAFQDGVYTRLKPLIENIAQAHIDAEIILDRMSSIDLKVQNILKERYSRDIGSGEFMKEPIAVNTSIKFVFKAIFLIVITMVFFNLILNFNIGGITPYAILLIFIIWWGFITSEYNLWKETSAWTAVFLPILVIPITIMLLGSLLKYNVLIAELYFSAGLYTLAYYLWAIYTTTGTLPFLIPKKKEQVPSEFFALQKKGIFKELIESAIERIDLKMKENIKNNELKDDNKNNELKYVWNR